MLSPDVLEIIDDPEIAGGQPFTVLRKTLTRVRGGVNESVDEYAVTGNIQPAGKGVSPSQSEDEQNESITIWTKFTLQCGEPGTAADEIVFNGKRWRLTSVDDYSGWGFTIGHATRVRE